ncbi:Myb/SANT-like domain-containing protein [Cinnamomum micranthum f. kanehirae]|uniref:Myb/SANT-like domain-containing protein n=1 Tax=Cinnamomum micranthum f. kanehirae TaxID=337451 RepID=A0A3S3N9G5_9MAGN|nr:Myb/SANT-like domain-containing protein [Cinnamomum micranthum f. kanehirae]
MWEAEKERGDMKEFEVDTDNLTTNNLKWTPPHDEKLIEVMVDQCREGRGMKGGFTCEEWNLLTQNMKSEFGESIFTKDMLKNRFKTLKKTYANMKAMLDLSGFGWDDTRKLVTTEPEAHPKAIQYKDKSLLDWASLAIIFGDSVVDGRDGFASNDPEPVEAGADDDIGLTQADEMDNVFENGLEDNDVSVCNARKRQFSSVSTSRHTAKNRANTSRVIIGAVETIANGFSKFANKRSKERLSVDKCIRNLAELGLPSGLFYKALRFLENERKTEFFVALPPMDRDGWRVAKEPNRHLKADHCEFTQTKKHGKMEILQLQQKRKEWKCLLETEQMPELTVTPHLEGSSIACVTLMLLEAVLLLIKLQRHFGLDLITDVSGSQQSLDGRPLVKLR